MHISNSILIDPNPETVLKWVQGLGDSCPAPKRVRSFCKQISRNPNRAAVIQYLARAIISKDCKSEHGVLLVLSLLTRQRDHQLALDLTEVAMSWQGRGQASAEIIKNATVLRGQSLLLSDMKEEAAQHIEHYTAELAQLTGGNALLSWHAWWRGDMIACEKFFLNSNHKQAFVLQMDEPSLSLEVERLVPEDCIKVFLSTYNERELLPQFLHHYRQAGSVHFFVVDNGSSDGTKSFLAECADVTLYTTEDSFGASGFGSSWINILLERHSSFNEMCIRVDADEFLVQNDFESLQEYLTACRDEGADIVTGTLVDMFPQDPSYSAQSDLDPGDRTLAEAVWFDPDIRREPSIFPPYRIDRGGFRERAFFATTNLTKSPIVRGGGNIRYLNANHSTTPGKISRRKCALLHYKLTPGSRNRYIEQVARGEHYEAGARYRKFLQIIDVPNNLVAENSVRYRSPSDLVIAGIL